ncbi:hypothetical protein [Ramlibacter sp.]|uniref:hypothetical protein n=1 Tax=Ramlibacter sp. TaxID=1917967 RepID=UPI002B8664BE|nr:hypothetical protein [Ramlibacter sp.]HWI80448.1 hypothetical protein [Ramlibacter sp.]
MNAMFTMTILGYPGADLDEFDALARVPGLRLVVARSCAQAQDAECLVLPGSGATGADLRWLRRQGLDNAVALHAQARRPVLGLGAGLHMLGEALIDPQDIAGNGPGIGLLPLVTQLEPARAPAPAPLSFGAVIGHWAPLAGRVVPALEVRQGRSVKHPGMGPVLAVLGGGLGWQSVEGNVLGLAVRGLFQDAGVLQALFGAA